MHDRISYLNNGESKGVKYFKSLKTGLVWISDTGQVFRFSNSPDFGHFALAQTILKIRQLTKNGLGWPKVFEIRHPEIWILGESGL